MSITFNNCTYSSGYEYGPFGEVFCSVGDMAKVNPFQFSTKYTDNETDLVYYGYRYYSPALGRWMSRDPIEEKGGLNLYGFVGNDGINYLDPLGNAYGNPISGGPGLIFPLPPCNNDCRVPSEISNGWISAISMLTYWNCGASEDYNFGPETLQSRQIKNSCIAEKIRTAFLKKNYFRPCKCWINLQNFYAEFGASEFFSEFANGTAEFVGSAIGNVYIEKIDCLKEKVIVKFEIENTTSIRSLVGYRHWHNYYPFITINNITYKSFPFTNWKQTYQWEEEFDCERNAIMLLSAPEN